MTMHDDFAILNMPYTTTWGDSKPVRVQDIDAALHHDHMVDMYESSVGRMDDDEWDRWVSDDDNAWWGELYDENIMLGGVAMSYDMLHYADPGEPDYYSAMVNTLMGMDVDITEDPRPVHASMSLHVVYRHGCCSAHSNRHKCGFARQNRPNFKDKRRK